MNPDHNVCKFVFARLQLRSEGRKGVFNGHRIESVCRSNQWKVPQTFII